VESPNTQYIAQLKRRPVSVIRDRLLQIRLQLALDQGKRQQRRLVDDLDRKGAIGVRVLCRDAVLGERARVATEIDAVGPKALGSSGELAVRHGDMQHGE
jgi:hypothetical protein